MSDLAHPSAPATTTTQDLAPTDEEYEALLNSYQTKFQLATEIFSLRSELHRAESSVRRLTDERDAALEANRVLSRIHKALPEVARFTNVEFAAARRLMGVVEMLAEVDRV